MLKPKLAALSLALVALPLAGVTMLSGCASTAHQESAGQYVDSSVITAKVKAKLLADKSVKSLPITVNTFRNTVQLSGFVDNSYQKQRAVELARSVEGVADVQDSLVIKKHR